MGQTLKLIDLDASVPYAEGAEGFSGMKFSSGFAPPELIYCDAQTVCVRSPPFRKGFVSTTSLFVRGEGLNFELLPASPAHDLWSLGVILYCLCTNMTLFLSTGDGNIEFESDLRILAEWSDETKAIKLKKVQHPVARSLIAQLLSKDPAYCATLS